MQMKYLLTFFLTMTVLISSFGQKSIRVQFHDNDSVIANPGQGWMSSRFPSTIKYVRLGWNEFEPERGKYDWTKIDNAISEAKQRGGKIAIRIMTCSPHSSGYYTSPKWLFDEGCKSFDYLVGGDDQTSGGIRIPRIEPDYSDSLFLLRHGEFIKALGEHYDNSSDIDFLDIGSYGYWGEWHTPHPAPVDVRKKIVDMYISSFIKKPLVFMSDDAEVLGYALNKGKSDPRSWFPGEISIQESILIPERIKKGSYKLALALENKVNNQPAFRLSIDVPETNGMYILSKIEVI